jgi:hypothetical protein
MKVIFDCWMQSLCIFSPSQFSLFLGMAAKCFLQALKIVCKYFGIFLLVDCIIFLLFGKVIFDIFHIPVPANITTYNVSFISIIVVLFLEVNWFIFSTAMLLFIRKKREAEPLPYFKQTCFFYLKLLFLFYLFFVVATIGLISFGITTIPQLPLVFMASQEVVKLLVIFYWLDSPMTIKNCLLSFEKSINFFVYNLPVFVFLITLLWGIDCCIKLIFCGTIEHLCNEITILMSRTEQFVKACPAQIASLRLLALRYLLFFVKYMWVCLIFIFYDQKKAITYSGSIFEVQQEK